MKIACVLGSPRKTGNSATIAGHLLKTAEDLGAETQFFVLNNTGKYLTPMCNLQENKDAIAPVIAQERK